MNFNPGGAMKTQQEIEREAERVLCNSMGVAHWTSGQCREAAHYLSAAGLLVTPTLLAVWDAANEWADLARPVISLVPIDHKLRGLLTAVDAHAATLRKPDPLPRYYADGPVMIYDRKTNMGLTPAEVCARLNAVTP